MTPPENVGIKAIEIYVPSQCLDQAAFEKHQGVSAGRYTIGLCQKFMNYCTDREDTCSLSLTAVSRLLQKYDIAPQSIGRLEVGSESNIDKAKSIKTVLMQLFVPSGNTNLEGADTINACYGGTNALFNAVNWIESRSWDGRDAIVVASDIASYNIPSARPTGGAGCVAMLIGPGAPLVIDHPYRGTFMTHAFDFYKPNPSSEYPLVDGQMSIQCYLQALDECYARLAEKVSGLTNGTAVASGEILQLFDYMAFHTPNCKLVYKSYARLMYNDFLRSKDNDKWKGVVPEHLQEMAYEESLTNKELEKVFINLSKKRFETSVLPSIEAPTLCGNMYTASVYCSLISLLSNIDLSKNLEGKRIGVFSYGSGISATLFSLKIVGDVQPMVKTVDLMKRLAERQVTGAEEYEEAYALREKAYGVKNFVPVGSTQNMTPGTYYLENIDDMYRRSYKVKV